MALLIGQRCVQQEPVHTDNTVHWGANFMAHIGQKFAFGSVRLRGCCCIAPPLPLDITLAEADEADSEQP